MFVILILILVFFLCVAYSIVMTCQNIRKYRDFFSCCSCGLRGGEGVGRWGRYVNFL